MHNRLADIQTILQSQTWMPYGFDPRINALVFVDADFDALEASVFVPKDWLLHRDTAAIALSQLIDALQHHAMQASTPRLILHTAFCASTLFARCLQTPPRCLVIRELPLYSGLVAARATLLGEGRDADWKMLRSVALTLPAQALFGVDVVVHKPSNVLLPACKDLFDAHADARAILIHSDFREFLVSCAKKFHLGNRKLIDMYAALDPQAQIFASLGMPSAALSPWHWAALIWHRQMLALDELIASRVTIAAIDHRQFLADPHSVIARAHVHLGTDIQDIADAHVDAALSRHAKSPGKTYGTTEKDREHEEVIAALGDTIERVMDWATATLGTPRTIPPTIKRL